MATFDELARDYSQRLAADASVTAARSIAEHLNSLVYSGSNNALSLQDKQQILEKTYQDLAGRPTYTKSADNQQYLQLINWILSQI